MKKLFERGDEKSDRARPSKLKDEDRKMGAAAKEGADRSKLGWEKTRTTYSKPPGK